MNVEYIFFPQLRKKGSCFCDNASVIKASVKTGLLTLSDTFLALSNHRGECCYDCMMLAVSVMFSVYAYAWR